MKKMIFIGLMTAFIAGVSVAQDDVVMVGQATDDFSQTKTTAEVALLTAYVWRGQVINNDFVIQPQMSISQYGVSFNVWGNYDLIENNAASSGGFSELDISVAYAIPLDINEMAFDVGLINYNFPREKGTGTNSTTEVFAKATVLSWQDYVIPSVTLFGDIDEAKGSYILFEVAAPYEISDYLSVEGGISAGWGNTAYNDYYFPNTTATKPNTTQDEGFNDYNFYAVANYEISDSLTVSANITFTTLEGGAIKNAAGSLYESKEKLWAGVNIAYDF